VNRILLSTFFAIGLALGGLLSPAPCHAGAPTDQVQAMLKEVMAVQVDPQLQGNSFRGKRRELIKTIIAKNFEFDQMAEGALRSYWKELDEKQRAVFKDVFKDLFQDSYTRLVLDFLKEEKILYNGEEVQQQGSMVKTVILRAQEQIPVDYVLMPEKALWRVRDVRIDGVSIVENYQKSFARVIRRESYDALLKKMQLQQQAIAAE
jgi:phospholipid transport system substrate-binding protein